MNSDIQQFKTEFFKALAHPMRIRFWSCLAKARRM